MSEALRYVPVAALGLGVTVAGVLAAVVGGLVGRRRRSRVCGVVAASRVLLAGAVLAVLAMTIKGGAFGGVNLVPFAGIVDELQNINTTLGVLNVVGNVLMFAPLGLLGPTAIGGGWRRTAICGGLLSIAIELSQAVCGRSADIDDVLLNVLGVAVGVLAGVAVERRVRGVERPPVGDYAGCGETVADWLVSMERARP